MSTIFYLAIKVSRVKVLFLEMIFSSETFRFLPSIVKHAEYSYFVDYHLNFIPFCTRLILNRLPKGDSQC